MPTGYKIRQLDGGVTWVNQTELSNTGIAGRIIDGMYNSTLGHYIVMSNYGTVGISTDQVNWTFNNNIRNQTVLTGSRANFPWGYNLSTDNYINRLVWTGTYYIAVGHASYYAYSADGVNWTSTFLNTGLGLTSYTWWANSGSTSVIGNNGSVGYKSTYDPTSLTGYSLTYITGNSNNAGIYAGGQYITVGNSGVVHTSANGSSWTARDITGSTVVFGIKPITAMTWDGSKYVAIAYGQNSTLSGTSTDGVTWTVSSQIATIFTSYSVDTLAYGNSTFVAINYYGKVATSTDGLTWTFRVDLNFAQTSDLIFANGKFVAVQGSGGVYHSTDGITWTNASANLQATTWGTNQVWSVFWDGSQFIIGGGSGRTATSPDAVTWTYRTVISNFTVFSFGKIGSNLVAFGQSSRVFTSTDGGTTWTDRTTNLTGTTWGASGTNITNCILDSTNSVLVISGASGGKIATSPDGITWTDRTANLTSTTFGAREIFCLAVNGSGRVLVGGTQSTSALAYTTNVGAAFTYVDTVQSSTYWSGAENCLGVVHNGTNYLIFGSLGGITTSADGITWTLRTNLRSGTFGAQAINTCIWDGSQYIAAGSDGKLATSADGVTWTVQTTDYTGTGTPSNHIAYSIWKYLTTYTLGCNGPILSNSTNLTSWTPEYGLQKIGWAATETLGATYDGRNYFIFGTNSKLARSSDGKAWYTQHLMDTTWGVNNINCVVWTGTQFVIGGNNGRIATSPDGTTWTYRSGLTSTTWSTTNVVSLAYSVKDNRIVAAGANGAIAYSTDGVTWTYVRVVIGISNTDFRVRAVVRYINNRFYLGWNNYYSISLDGITWPNEATNTGTSSNFITDIVWFEKQQQYICIATNGVGQDFWYFYYSSNGIAWTVGTQTGFSTMNWCSTLLVENNRVLAYYHRGSSGAIASTTNGTTWTTSGFLPTSKGTISTTQNVLISDNSSYLTAGKQGTVFTSSKNIIDVDDVLVRREYFSDGSLWYWNNTTMSPVTAAGSGLTWKFITSGRGIFGVKSDGTLWTWGNNQASTPTQVSFAGYTNNDWKSFACGYQGSGAQESYIGIKNDGNIWAWGGNSFGQLGVGDSVNKSSPVTAVGGGSWKQVVMGTRTDNIGSTMGIKTDGTLWYMNVSPVQVAGGGTWKQVATNEGSIAIKTDGTMWAWSGTSSPTTWAAAGSKTWKYIHASYRTAHAVSTDGSLWSWGNNSNGILGDGTTTNRTSFVSVTGGGTNWKSVFACGYWSTVVGLKTDGTLWSWGPIPGDGTAVAKSSPVLVAGGFTNWRSVPIGSTGGPFTAAPIMMIQDLTI